MAGDDGVARHALPARVTASDSSSVEKSDGGAPKDPKVMKRPASKKDETPNQPTDDELSPIGGGSDKDDESDDESGHVGSEDPVPRDLKVSKKPATRAAAAKKKPAAKRSRKKDRPMNITTSHQWNQWT